MNLGHLLYIPLIGLIGFAAGYVSGAKAVRRELEALARRSQK